MIAKLLKSGKASLNITSVSAFCLAPAVIAVNAVEFLLSPFTVAATDSRFQDNFYVVAWVFYGRPGSVRPLLPLCGTLALQWTLAATDAN